MAFRVAEGFKVDTRQIMIEGDNSPMLENLSHFEGIRGLNAEIIIKEWKEFGISRNYFRDLYEKIRRETFTFFL